MKALYTVLLAVSISGAAYSQQEHPQNATGNNSTAVTASLNNFQATRNANTVQISWNALYESNMSNHSIERSTNGSSFTVIGTLPAQNNAAPFKYNWLDPTPVAGDNYYRIRTIDKAGKLTYSNILRINNSFRKMDIRITPNPVQGGVINLQMANINQGKYIITLYNSAGQQVLSRSLELTEGSTTQNINVSQNLARGMYTLHVNNGDTRINKQVMLQ